MSAAIDIYERPVIQWIAVGRRYLVSERVAPRQIEHIIITLNDDGSKEIGKPTRSQG